MARQAHNDAYEKAVAAGHRQLQHGHQTILSIAIQAAAASDHGDLLKSTILKRALAKVNEASLSAVYRVVREVEPLLRDNPEACWRFRRALELLQEWQVKVYLPPAWARILAAHKDDA